MSSRTGISMDSKQLRDKIKSFPMIDDGHPFWVQCRQELRDNIIRYSPETFRSWFVIKQTMDVGNAEYVKQEWVELTESPLFGDYLRAFEWENLYRKDIGYVKEASGNSIHHVYHIDKLLRMYKRNIFPELKAIYEFGAGFGSTCAIIHKLGFTGKYYITDFPEFCALQEYYLSTQKIDTQNIHWGYAQVPQSIMPDLDLFIAEWSLSEVANKDREGYSRVLAKNYLLAYSLEFMGQDNKEFFNKFINNGNRCTLWQRDYTIHDNHAHEYLIGCE